MPASAFEYFLNRKNARIVQLLEKNREISEAMQGLLENIVEHCDNKGWAFEKVAIRDAFIANDGNVSLKIVPRG